MRHILRLAALALVGTALAQSPQMTVHLQGGGRLSLSTDQIRSLVFSGLTTVQEPGTDPGFVLHPAWPNPFNPTTTLAFELPEASSVTLRILDLRGALVTTLIEGRLEAGLHQVDWDGRNSTGMPVASGLYLASICRGEQASTRKLILMN